MFITLMYHSVDDSQRSIIAIPARTFEAHLRLLREEGYTVLSSQQALAVIAGTWVAPPRSVFLTFDDAYQDNVEVALPILQQHQMSAMLFVPSAHIGADNRWHPGAHQDTRHLTWEGLRQWQQGGGEIGAHTHEHYSVLRMSEAELRYSFQTNNTLLEQELGVQPTTFAYPYGMYNEMALRVVNEFYQMAFSVEEGNWNPLWNRHTIKRISITPMMTLTQFSARLEQTATSLYFIYP
jgi:peptidoglycan/xylan/chitin deacetylase (PgdA/CDA1 family)